MRGLAPKCSEAPDLKHLFQLPKDSAFTSDGDGDRRLPALEVDCTEDLVLRQSRAIHELSL